MIKRILLVLATSSLAMSVHAAEVKVGALVSGQVTQVMVKTGQKVKAGQLVLKIDDRRYQAKLKVLKAEVAYRETALADMQIEFDQTQDLYDRTVIARRPYERAKTDFELAQSALNKAQAELEMHQAWSDYFQVKAPVAGEVKSIVTQGTTVFKENDALFSLEIK
ncbi:efflux RND transporter periplasmic adaptor subunit [Thiomicrospira sp.]|uniref:efflux RND transporter periplasmic adaptor subunit n=1 Tax=Thiomicrospira sp. TaxID=935 RepID=UPI002F9326F1